MVNEKHAPLDCPNCHRADSVQKVTSIRRSGTTAGTFDGKQISGAYNFGDSSISLGGGKLSGSTISISNLSESLAPPEFTQAPNQGCLMLGFVASFLLALLFLISVFSAGAAWLIGFVIFGLLGAILFWIYKTNDDDYSKYLKEGKPKDDKALEQWNRLYYCHRCDGVFLPGKPMSSVENMINYLYTVK